MPFDENSDMILKSVGEAKTGGDEIIRVNIVQYKGGEPKIALQRLNPKSEEGKQFRKLGRLTLLESQNILPLFTKATNDLEKNYETYKDGKTPKSSKGKSKKDDKES